MGRSDYSGGTAPGSVRIESDGRFMARAAVPRGEDMPMADASARQKLVEAAAIFGFESFKLEDVRRFNFFGHRVVMTGMLYRQGEGPRDAVPLAMLSNESEAEPRIASQRPIAPVRAALPVENRVAPPASLSSEEEPVVAASDAPVVIEAPEFVDEKPKKPVR